MSSTGFSSAHLGSGRRRQALGLGLRHAQAEVRRAGLGMWGECLGLGGVMQAAVCSRVRMARGLCRFVAEEFSA